MYPLYDVAWSSQRQPCRLIWGPVCSQIPTSMYNSGPDSLLYHCVLAWRALLVNLFFLSVWKRTISPLVSSLFSSVFQNSLYSVPLRWWLSNCDSWSPGSARSSQKFSKWKTYFHTNNRMLFAFYAVLACVLNICCWYAHDND